MRAVAREPKPPRVLVAEDDPSLRTLISDVLSLDGYVVTEAATALEMEAAIENSSRAGATPEPFDVVVTDIRMPGKSGLDALSDLQSRGTRSRFVVITAFPEDATERRIRELRAFLLAKPFTLVHLRSLVRALLAVEPESIPS